MRLWLTTDAKVTELKSADEFNEKANKKFTNKTYQKTTPS